MSDAKDGSCPNYVFASFVQKTGIKRVAAHDFPRYVPVHMSHHYYKFQTRWSARILRDWWRCQLRRDLRDPRGLHRDEPVPEFVHAALSWLLQRDTYDWPVSGVRYRLSQIYDELEFALFNPNDSCVKVKGPSPSDRSSSC